MTSSNFRNELGDTSAISILNAENDFKSRVKKVNESIQDPNSINEEINYLRENFSKLKFQYLEQETKEKFLRSLLESSPPYVGQDDINKLEANNQETKRALKSLKDAVTHKSIEIEDITRETIDLCEEFMSKKNEVESMLADFEDIERKLDDATKNQSEDAKVILNSVAELSINFNEEDTNSLLAQAEIKVAQSEANRMLIENELKLRTGLHESLKVQIRKLWERLESLRSSAEEVKSFEEPSKAQIYAQWVKEMSDIIVQLDSSFPNPVQ